MDRMPSLPNVNNLPKKLLGTLLLFRAISIILKIVIAFIITVAGHTVDNFISY